MKPQTSTARRGDILKLVAQRKAKAISVETLAAAIGIHPQTLYRLEAGKRRPLKITLRAWRAALDGSKP